MRTFSQAMVDAGSSADRRSETTQHSLALVAAVACAGCAIFLCSVVAGQRRRLAVLEEEVNHEKELRESEHSGRIRSEKELRVFMSSRMKADGGLFFAPIATVFSCFKECVGTPRQGQFAPSTRALLVFDKSSVSPVSLDGLEGFSHLWIFWAFHLNTNSKDARAHSGVRSDSRGHTFPAKVSPPFLKRRVGVFSTRTPHRPNPIGVSLCRIEAIDTKERSVTLSGVDLVDGTPVLDIKPYVPDYDCPRSTISPTIGGAGDSWGRERGAVRVADWVEASVKHRRTVEWAPEAESQLEQACSDGEPRSGGTEAKIRFFAGDHAGAKQAITESLAVDIRSLHKTRLAHAAPSCTLLFDGLRVEFAATVTTSCFEKNAATTSHHAIGGAPNDSKPSGSRLAQLSIRLASNDARVRDGERRDRFSAEGGERETEMANGGDREAFDAFGIIDGNAEGRDIDEVVRVLSISRDDHVVSR